MNLNPSISGIHRPSLVTRPYSVQDHRLLILRYVKIVNRFICHVESAECDGWCPDKIPRPPAHAAQSATHTRPEKSPPRPSEPRPSIGHRSRSANLHDFCVRFQRTQPSFRSPRLPRSLEDSPQIAESMELLQGQARSHSCAQSLFERRPPVTLHSYRPPVPKDGAAKPSSSLRSSQSRYGVVPVQTAARRRTSPCAPSQPVRMLWKHPFDRSIAPNLGRSQKHFKQVTPLT